MNPDFADTLESCLQQLQQGETPENCLLANPQYAEELQPLLEVAVGMMHKPLIQPRPQAVQAGLERMLNAAQVAREISPSAVSNAPRSRYTVRILSKIKTLLIGDTKNMKFALRLALDMVAILLVGSFLTANAAASSIPGDTLYGLKRTWEDVRMDLTLDPQSRQSLETQFALERQTEIQAMSKLGRQGSLDIEGVLEAVDGNTWTVSGLLIDVPSQTSIEGNFQVGSQVTVQALVRPDGDVVAQQVQFHNTEPAQGPLPTFVHQPEHTLDPTHGPAPTYGSSHEGEPTHTVEPTHEVEPTYEPTHPVEPTQTAVATHEPENNPKHEPEPGHQPAGEPGHEPGHETEHQSEHH